MNYAKCMNRPLILDKNDRNSTHMGRN